MISSSRPVVVGVNGTTDSDPAVQWAAQEAATLGVPLRLLHVYSLTAVYGSMGIYPIPAEIDPFYNRDIAQDLVDVAVARQLKADPGGPATTGAVVEGPRVSALLEASAEASVIVVGSRLLGPIGATILGSTGAAVAARATCPAVVVRGPSGDPANGARVVVGVDLSPLSDPTLGYAFEHASRYGVALRAVLAWYSGPPLLARWTESDKDVFRARGERMLAEALAGWQEKHPDVTVERVLVDLHPVDALVAESATAHTLVVGAHNTHARWGSMLGSVSQGVLHHASCPVVVVHAQG